MLTASPIVRALLRAMIAVTAIGQIIHGDLFYGLFCLAALAATIALGRWIRIADGSFPISIDLLLLGVMVLDMTLGMALGLYTRLPWWDKALHFGSSAVLGLLGFLVIYIIHITGRIRLHPILDGVAILLITLGLGALWEIGEYLVDVLGGRATQGSPGMGQLEDTMVDLILDGCGGVVAAIIGPLYMRYSKRSRRRVGQLGAKLARHERLAPQT